MSLANIQTKLWENTYIKNYLFSWAVVVHTFNPSTRDLYEFEATLIYRVRSKKAKAVTRRNPVSKNNKNLFLTLLLSVWYVHVSVYVLCILIVHILRHVEVRSQHRVSYSISFSLVI